MLVLARKSCIRWGRAPADVIQYSKPFWESPNPRMAFSGVSTLGVILRRRCIPLMDIPSIPCMSLPLVGRAFVLEVSFIHSYLCLYPSFKSDLIPSASLATPSRRKFSSSNFASKLPTSFSIFPCRSLRTPSVISRLLVFFIFANTHCWAFLPTSSSWGLPATASRHPRNWALTPESGCSGLGWWSAFLHRGLRQIPSAERSQPKRGPQHALLKRPGIVLGFGFGPNGAQRKSRLP